MRSKPQRAFSCYGGDSHLRGFSRWDQFLTMAFAQLTYRKSLRDITASLRSMSPNKLTWDML